MNKKITKAASWVTKPTFKTTQNECNYKVISTKNRRCITREQLPSPFFYYRRLFPNITKGRGWVSVCCCFHKDSNPSLSLNLESGGFFCHACGAKGGDLIIFHRQRFKLGFRETVFQLKNIRREESK